MHFNINNHLFTPILLSFRTDENVFCIITGGNYSLESRNLVNFHISTTLAFPSSWRL